MCKPKANKMKRFSMSDIFVFVEGNNFITHPLTNIIVLSFFFSLKWAFGVEINVLKCIYWHNDQH